MTELQQLRDMLRRAGIEIICKHNTQWVTRDRIIIDRVGGTKLCFSFDRDGQLLSMSWGEHVDQEI